MTTEERKKMAKANEGVKVFSCQGHTASEAAQKVSGEIAVWTGSNKVEIVSQKLHTCYVSHTDYWAMITVSIHYREMPESGERFA